MPDSQLHLKSKTEPSEAKAENFVRRKTQHGKNLFQEEGTPHILSEQGDKMGGHHTSKFDHMFILGWGHHTKFEKLALGRVGGWVCWLAVGLDMIRIMALRSSILQHRTCKILS